MVSPFENDDTIKRDFSYSDIIILIKILNSNENNVFETYESKLAREIGYSPSRIAPLLNYLRQIEIVENGEMMGSNKTFKINRYLLKHFLDEQDILLWLDENYLNKYNDYRYKDL